MQNPTIVNGFKNADDFIFLLGNLPSYIIHRVSITTAAPAPLRRGGMIKRSRYCYYINWLFRTSRSTEFQTLSFLEVEHPSIHLPHILHLLTLSHSPPLIDGSPEIQIRIGCVVAFQNTRLSSLVRWQTFFGKH